MITPKDMVSSFVLGERSSLSGVSSISGTEDSCRNGNYHDHDTGLEFITFCDFAFDGLDIPNGELEELTPEDCMRKCSTYSGVSGCWGVSFTPPYTCLLKGRGISFDLDDLQSEPGSTLGLVWPTSQMEPLSSVLPECSYRNGSVIFSSTMKFEIFCNSDLDAPAWVSGTLNVPNKHFNSFDQCLAYCELGGQPQCQAVVFDPTLSSGYLNCIPKMVSIQNVSMALVPQTDPLRHAAVAIVPELNESCVDGPIDQLFNDKRFSLSCDQEITGNQIGERFRTNSLKDCIAACAERIGSSSSVGECTAVTWDPNMQEHYANCYLHLSPWKPSRMDGMISALLTKDQVTPDETAFVPAGHSVNGKSNTWIAGAVIGPVAFAVILACLIWFCIRGRGQMPRQTDMNLPEVIEPAELDQTTRDTRSPAEFDGENSRVEVDSQALREIDSQEVFEGNVKEQRERIELDVRTQL